MPNTKFDENFQPSLIAVSDVDSKTIVLLEADPTTNRLKVTTTVSGTPKVDSATYALQFATDSGTSTTFYLGEAVEGSATSAAVWRIQRIQTASGVQIDWADGDSDFDGIFDDRESLSYS